MSSSSRRVARNIAVLMTSQVLTWGLSLLLTLFLPRYLGPTGIGKYYLAGSLWAMLSIFVSFGGNLLVTKEVARHPQKIETLIGTSILSRSIFYVLALGALALYLSFVDYPPETIFVIYLIGAGNLFAQINDVCRSVLQGVERMEYISTATIVSRAVTTVVTIGMLLAGFGLITVILINISTTLLEMAILITALRRLEVGRPRFQFDTAKWMLSAGMPYLMTSVFLVFYGQMDVLVISWVVDETTIGWYTVAKRFFATFLFVPTVFMQAAFPALSRTYEHNPASLWKLTRQAFRWLLLLGVPIGIGLTVIADNIVLLIYGEAFTESGPVLAVFGIVLVIMYLTILFGRVLIAADRQRLWTIVMGLALAATLPLDLVLIPWCAQTFNNGAIGGALAYIVTEGAMVVIGLWVLPRQTLRRSEILFAGRVLIAGLAMGALTWWWRDSFIAIPILIGVISYPLILLILRAAPEEEKIIQATGRRLFQQARGRLSRVEV